MDIGGVEVSTTSNHPFWVVGKGWVPADELTVGDELELEDGSTRSVDAISLQFAPIRVYNFTVVDFHTYCISELYILTHNLTEACNNAKRITKKC